MVHYLAVAMLAATSLAATPGKLDWQADYGQALAATRSDQRSVAGRVGRSREPRSRSRRDLLSRKASTPLCSATTSCATST